jgi:hypothetical protein
MEAAIILHNAKIPTNSFPSFPQAAAITNEKIVIADFIARWGNELPSDIRPLDDRDCVSILQGIPVDALVQEAS